VTNGRANALPFVSEMLALGKHGPLFALPRVNKKLNAIRKNVALYVQACLPRNFLRLINRNYASLQSD
jgi:hypothetical protein